MGEALTGLDDFLWCGPVVFVEPGVGILGVWEVGCIGSSWCMLLDVPVTGGEMVWMSWWVDLGAGGMKSHAGMLPWW